MLTLTCLLSFPETAAAGTKVPPDEAQDSVEEDEAANVADKECTLADKEYCTRETQMQRIPSTAQRVCTTLVLGE